MTLYKALDQFQKLLTDQAWDDLEALGKKHATKLASAEQAERIEKIDVRLYAKALKSSLSSALKRAKTEKAAAVYFELNLDNGWSSQFFLCNSYAPAKAKDDEWASDWEESVDGPNCPQFGKLYQMKEGTFDESDFSRGTTLYLIARTLACLGRALKLPPSPNVPICAGYHDQEHLYRLWEPTTKPKPSRKKTPAPYYQVVWGMALGRSIVKVVTRGAPKDLELPEGKTVRGWKPLCFKVDSGVPVDLNINGYGCRLFSARAREVLEQAVTGDEGMQWLPVELEHGKKRLPYFILHFTRCVDGLDQARSTVFNGRVWDAVLVKDKLDGRTAFTCCGTDIAYLVVTAEVKEAMEAAKLTGVGFLPVKLS